MAAHEIISAKELRQILHYDPDTGGFIWHSRPLRPGLERIDKGWNVRMARKPVAVRLDRQGYRQIGITPYGNIQAHRLAWFYVHGVWPKDEIDHINGDPLDNRICNLREADRVQNCSNQKIRTDNTSGVKGVSWQQKTRKWYAYITHAGKMYARGTYDLFEDAVAARKKAASETFGNNPPRDRNERHRPYGEAPTRPPGL